MNIFFLDRDTDKCAQYHCDQHVLKMIVEYAQLLSTAHHVLNPEVVSDRGIYKATHKNHPCAVWVRESWENYHLLAQLLMALCAEYTRRYGKVHATQKVAVNLLWAPHGIPLAGKATDPPQCMPDAYKLEDTVEAYRQYYMADKSWFAKWNYGPKPSWWEA